MFKILPFLLNIQYNNNFNPSFSGKEQQIKKVILNSSLQKDYFQKSTKKGSIYEPFRDIITQMVHENKSYKEIAEKIGKDVQFVGSAKQYFGLTNPRNKKGDAYEPFRDIITQMIKEGKSRKEIAEKIGKDVRFVGSAKQYFGLTNPKPHSNKKGVVYEPYRDIITQMVNKKKSYKEIAKKIGKNEKFVYKAKRYFNLCKKSDTKNNA